LTKKELSSILKLVSRKILFLIFAFVLSFVFPTEILAAKPRLSRGGSSPTAVTSSGYRSSAKFKANRLGIILSLSGLNNTNSVSYELTYTSEGIPQGVISTVQTTENTATREMLFGTCSKNVCRWHTNIKDAKLIVTAKLKSGKTSRKTYRIRV
jgi:hypothetical protein